MLGKKKSQKQEELRLRLFAGPNGSGKSIIIGSIRNFKIKGRKINFGYYINADDIALLLNENCFDFSEYDIEIANKEFTEIVLSSGLVPLVGFSIEVFPQSYILLKNIFWVKNKAVVERLAQIIADRYPQEIIKGRKTFLF